MKHDRKKEIIACCEGIIRDADNIAKELECNQDLEIMISLNFDEVPNVTITKNIVPKEVIDVLMYDES